MTEFYMGVNRVTKLWLLKMQKKRIFYSMALFVILGLVVGMFSFEYADEQDLAIKEKQTTQAPQGKVSLNINITKRTLEVYSDGQLHKKYRIAVGKGKTPSPIGEWNVVWKDYNWGTGFGTRWMGLNVPWGIYGIHGTNKPWSIGQFASHGCIRMRNKDVEELFEWVPIGTPVHIEGRKVKVTRLLKYQCTGPDVVVVQLKLKEMGYLNERADGIYGKVTETAVQKYQEENGLEVTGVVNKEMVSKLDL
jgi:hypothetical protein